MEKDDAKSRQGGEEPTPFSLEIRYPNPDIQTVWIASVEGEGDPRLKFPYDPSVNTEDGLNDSTPLIENASSVTDVRNENGAITELECLIPSSLEIRYPDPDPNIQTVREAAGKEDPGTKFLHDPCAPKQASRPHGRHTRILEIMYPDQDPNIHTDRGVQVQVELEGDPSLKFPYDPSVNTENGLDHSIFITIESKLNQTLCQKSHNWSIAKVPSHLRTIKPDVYIPQLVSIGPIHHRKDSNLQAMEHYKLGFMQCLLNRTPNPKDTLSKCTQAVLGLEQNARSCYADIDHVSIAEILLVDGCFIIELFLKFSKYTDRTTEPLFSNVWMVAAFQKDLSLLENQIPFSVLETLFQITAVNHEACQRDQRMWANVAKLAFEFLKLAMPLNPEALARNIEKDAVPRHLLDLVHNCLEPEDEIMKPCDGYYKRPHYEGECLMRTIGELVSSGLKVKGGDANDPVGIKFDEGNGILKIPTLCVGDMTEKLLRNLVAYEQYCNPGRRHIISYVLLMDRLIDSERDVEVLEKAGVLKNSLGQLGRVVDLFNDLGVELVTTPEDKYMYSEMCVKVDKYYSKWWPRNKAMLRRDYFPNIWQIVAFVIAFLVLATTIEQAVYAALP